MEMGHINVGARTRYCFVYCDDVYPYNHVFASLSIYSSFALLFRDTFQHYSHCHERANAFSAVQQPGHVVWDSVGERACVADVLPEEGVWERGPHQQARRGCPRRQVAQP